MAANTSAKLFAGIDALVQSAIVEQDTDADAYATEQSSSIVLRILWDHQTCT